MVWIQIAFVLLFTIGLILFLNPILISLTHLYIYQKRRGWKKERVSGLGLESKVFADLREILSVARVPVSPFTLILLSLLFFAVGLIVFSTLFNKGVHSFFLALIVGSIPSTFVWFRLQHYQQKMAMVMLPTVQNFISFYSKGEGVRHALYVSSNTMPHEIRYEWDRMNVAISTGTLLEEAILNFAKRINNEWAHDFADILLTRIETGTDITESLFRLVAEIQRTLYNEEKRIQLLLVYRWGTFLMLLLAMAIVAINIYLDPTTRYYYFEDPFGKGYTTFSVVILFISFIGALLMGRKRI